MTHESVMVDLSACLQVISVSKVFNFVWFGALCPSHQLLSCQDGQIT